MALDVTPRRKRVERLEDRFEFQGDGVTASDGQALRSALFRVVERRTGAERVLRVWRKTGSAADRDLRQLWEARAPSGSAAHVLGGRRRTRRECPGVRGRRGGVRGGPGGRGHTLLAPARKSGSPPLDPPPRCDREPDRALAEPRKGGASSRPPARTGNDPRAARAEDTGVPDTAGTCIDAKSRRRASCQIEPVRKFRSFLIQSTTCCGS